MENDVYYYLVDFCGHKKLMIVALVTSILSLLEKKGVFWILAH